MRTRTWCVVVALLSCSVPTAGQTVISEQEALARLSADSPRVRAIQAGVGLVRAEALGASRWPNPRVTFNRESVSGVSEHMVMVTQALPVTGRRAFEISAATALVAATQSRADEDVRRARAALGTAYARLVSAQVRESELARARDRVRELADVLARREAAGDAAGYDRLRAEREVIDVEEEWATARADRAHASAILASFLRSGDDGSNIVAVTTAPTRVAIPAVDDLVARAELVRGEPAALQHEIRAAGFAARAASRRLVPEPEVVAGTKSSNVGTGDVGGVLAVHASIPLFDRARPERALARAQLAQAETRAELFRVQVRSEISAWRAVVLERRAAADRYRGATTDSTAGLERIAQVAYDAGEKSILELLDAYRTGSSARVRLAELDGATRLAEIELEFVSGWEIR